MKAQLILIAFCIALTSCKKNVNEVAPTPQPLDTNINLVGTWRIDSATSYSMSFEQPFRPQFKSSDSLKFYSSINQELSFAYYYYCYNPFDYHALVFIKDSLITLFPFSNESSSPLSCKWKQMSNTNGMLTNFIINQMSDNMYIIDKNSLTFKILRTDKNSIKLTIEPFMELIHKERCSGWPNEWLEGYYLNIYLTQSK